MYPAILLYVNMVCWYWSSSLYYQADKSCSLMLLGQPHNQETEDVSQTVHRNLYSYADHVHDQWVGVHNGMGVLITHV